jgi:hypothetical protein
MAIYNPKRARELEAAARLAESQRQRELAKGQREQRTTEQILGLVEGLIGAAPQVVGGLQDVQAQQVLAGEKPLPEQKPETDNILENIGRFITDPFEAGVRQRVAKMAPQQLAAKREVLKPLTTQQVTKGLAGKYEEELGVPLPPQMGAERAAEDVIATVPAAKFVPEAERKAMVAGDIQRVQAEQTAAEREAEMFGLQKRKIEAEAEAKEAQAKKLLTEAESKKQQVAPARMKELSRALVAGVRSYAQDLQPDLNSTDPKIRGAAIDRLNEQMMLEAITIRNSDGTPINQDSPIARAAAGEAVAQLAKELELPKLADSSLMEFADAKNAIEEVSNLVERRKQLGDFPVDGVDAIAEKLAQATPEVLGAQNFINEMRKLALSSGMTNEQFSWMMDAEILRNRLITEEFRGTGAISDQERASIRDNVLTPIASYDQFRQRAYDTLKNVSNKFLGRVNTYREVNQIPSNVLSFADRLSNVIGGDPEGIALRIIGEKPTGGKKTVYELTDDTTAEAAAKLGMAPGQVIGGVVSRGVDFLADTIQRALGTQSESFDLVAGGAVRTFTARQLGEMAQKNPDAFKRLLSLNPDAAKKISEIVGVQ